MADNNPLTTALNTLDTTIQTITEKVEASKNGVREYKAKIIAKLNEINEAIGNLKDNNNLKALPALRVQLESTKTELDAKTRELDSANASLSEANANLQAAQRNIADITQQLETVNRQLAELNRLGEQKDTTIGELNAQVTALNAQKEALTAQKAEAERNLAAAQQETSGLVDKIGVINANLVQQIELIDTIVNGLGDLDSGDVSEQFNDVSSNIQAIMTMINSSPGTTVQGGQQGAPQFSEAVNTAYNKFMNSLQTEKEALYRKIQQVTGNGESVRIIQLNLKKTDPDSINIVKEEFQKFINASRGGGKRKRKQKTMKKRSKRTKKLMKNLKGGYVYSSSKDLDKASSIISASSKSKSNSNSKSKSKSKSNSSKKSHKTKRRSKQ